MDEQLRMFGARQGPIVECSLEVTPPVHGFLGKVSVTARSEMRRAPMGLWITSIPEREMASVIGQVMPLILQSHYVGADRLRQNMWGAYRRLGVDGKEIEIRGCGAER